MGWLEGVLTGYAKRHYEIEDQKRKEAGDAAEREGRVFETLLNSPYKDIQQYTMAGMLDLSNPKRRKGGVAGWMGEVETTPYLDMIRRTQTRLDEDPNYAKANLRESYYPWLGQSGSAPGSAEPEQGGTPPATPSVPTPAGQVAPAAGTPPGALPSTSAVTGGPVTPPTPAPPAPPGAGAPPSLNFSDYLRKGDAPPPPAAPPAPPAGPAAAAAPSGGPPAPQAGTPTPPPLGVQAGPPVPPGGAVPPAAAGAPAPASTPGMVAPGMPSTPPPSPPASTAAFGTPIPRRTQLPGIFPTQADTQQAQARAVVQGKIEGYAEMYRAQGFPEDQAYAKAAKLFEQDLLNTGAGGLGQGYAEGNVLADPASPTGYSQTLYLRRDPTQQMHIPAQAPKNATYATAEGLHTDWMKVQGPLREMQRQFKLMETGLQQYNAGEHIASVEAIRVTLEKVLDPNSVVREGEYARQGYGLALKDRLEGLWQKYAAGGGDIPGPILAEMVETARQFLVGMNGWNDNERQRITNLATINRIDPALIFGGTLQSAPGATTTPTSTTPAPGTTTPGATTTPAPGAAGATPMYRWDAAQNKYVLVK